MDTLDQLIVNEHEKNKVLPWNNLDKSIKLKKIMEFITTFSTQNDLSDEEINDLKILLREKIQRKQLQKTKDVVYDINSGLIKHIPALSYADGQFHYKNIDRASPLNSLAPKNKTVRKDNKG
jgi:hypothetical protein